MAVGARFVAVATTAVALGAAVAAQVSIRPDPARFYTAIRTNNLAQVRALAADDPNLKDDRGTTPLMKAAAFGSIDAMRSLIDAGADVNAANEGGATALMWCVTDPAKVMLLIEHHANVNAVSNRGRSPLFLAAMSDDSAGIVRALMKAGAKTSVVDTAGMTLLHAATVGGDVETIRLMIEAGLDVNARDGAKFTPLMNAAQRGLLPPVRLLLAKHADVNAISDRGDIQTHTSRGVKNGPLALGHFTALNMAAAAAPTGVIKALIDAGADVNIADIRGMTPLITTVASDHVSTDTVRVLLDAGADVKATTPEGETALDWARKAGRTPVVAMLEAAGAPGTSRTAPEIPAASPANAAASVTRAVSLLERTTGQFFTAGGCASCHAQNITEYAVGAARARGFETAPALVDKRVDETLGRFRETVGALLERVDTAGSPDVPASALNAVARGGAVPDEGTDALAANIAAQQLSDGRWFIGGIKRPPMMDGDITRTAQVIRALKDYAPPARAAEMNARIARGAAWLKSATPTTTQDRNMKLLGLSWAGAERAALRPLADAIVAKQRSDGGWAQRDELTSDAYATGQTLFALLETGMLTAKEAAVARGVNYLVSTQRADGSWFVASRAPKFQPYFDGGFPYGHNQWISSMATGWAATALAMTSKPAAATEPNR